MNCSPRNFNVQKRGKLFVVSAPSGAGKTSIINSLLKSKQDITLSVSYTTREKRESEIHGKDYVFTSKENFEKLLAEDFFLEHATIYGNYYGIPKINTNNVLSSGQNVIFVIDYHGFKVLKKTYTHDVVGIYILPPSVEALAYRLHSRAEDKNIEERINDFNNQLQVVQQYDYLIINDDLETAVQNISSIIEAEQLSMKSTIFSY